MKETNTDININRLYLTYFIRKPVLLKDIDINMHYTNTQQTRT